MKYIIILGDGMAGWPLEPLGGATTIQAANTPSMDRLAQMGRCGLLQTVPEAYEPGSEIANLAVLGYNLDEVFEGRGSLEAASMGIDIEPGEMAMRCNLITINGDGRIKNHSAGHITTPEGAVLMEYLQQELGGGNINFFPGVSYRHLVKIKGGDKHLSCIPPHNVMGELFADVMIKANTPEAEATAKLLNDLTLRSQELLAQHPINLRRIAEGKDPANSISMWSPGYKPAMPTLREKYGLCSSSVISAVDLIRGIGVYAGMKVIEVEGATGLYDTNYRGKATAAIEALRSDDFVFLHIEASDEAGHEGDPQLKIQTIENLSELVVGPIMEATAKMEEDVTIALLPDHPTPCAIKTHSRDAVPFVIYNPKAQGDSVQKYDEESAKEGYYGQIVGSEFMDRLLEK